jgi:hypothetical protein
MIKENVFHEKILEFNVAAREGIWNILSLEENPTKPIEIPYFDYIEKCSLKKLLDIHFVNFEYNIERASLELIVSNINNLFFIKFLCFYIRSISVQNNDYWIPFMHECSFNF